MHMLESSDGQFYGPIDPEESGMYPSHYKLHILNSQDDLDELLEEDE